MKPFSAWEEGLPYYAPAIIVGALLTAFLSQTSFWWLGLPFTTFGAFALFFFRDFHREIAAKGNDIVSPADGTIVAIEDLDDSPHYAGPCRRVSIFLSVFNAHVNRAPLAGTVTDITYQPGQFKNAMKAETSHCNEANTIRMETLHGPVTVRQISGAIARRIVCKVAVGNALAQGEKFGMIKFGSRTELYLPPTASICVTLREKVHAGTSIVGRFS